MLLDLSQCMKSDFGAESGIFWAIFPRLMCLAVHNRSEAEHRDQLSSQVLSA